VLLVLAMTFATACANQAPPSAAPAAKDGAPAAKGGAPEELVVVNFGGTFAQYWKEIIIEPFEKEHNAKVTEVTSLTMDTVAKMRAAAKFTKSRLYVDLTGKTFSIQTFDKTVTVPCPTGCWVTETAPTELSSTVSFSPGPVSTPPPDTQTTIDQSPACMNTAATPVAIANTACIIFNSRGLPIVSLASGAPTGDNAVYVTDGSAVYGVTVAATGFIRLWRTNAASAPTWTLQ